MRAGKGSVAVGIRKKRREKVLGGVRREGNEKEGWFNVGTNIREFQEG